MTDLVERLTKALVMAGPAWSYLPLVSEAKTAIETLTREKSLVKQYLDNTALRCTEFKAENKALRTRAEAAEASESALREALDNEREACAKIADEYAAPNRFSVHDCWKENQSPSQVYDTAAVDVGGWIANEIRARAFIEKHAPAATSEDK